MPGIKGNGDVTPAGEEFCEIQQTSGTRSLRHECKK